MSTPSYSAFAQGLVGETAFDVLAVAKRLKAAGKDVIELQIGDSPFPTTKSALAAGKKAIGIPAKAENVVVAPGAKVFETYFCELFVEPGDEVLLFSPQFPTFEPN